MSKLNEWKQGIEQVWESLSDGWRELRQRASGAVTRFIPHSDTSADLGSHARLLGTTGWGFLATDVFDDDDKVVVRLEAPGMRKGDFNIELHDHQLIVQGDKRFERETSRGGYRELQCAYGRFRRVVQLPVEVRHDRTKASYRDGVLRIEMPKVEGKHVRRIPVQLG